MFNLSANVDSSKAFITYRSEMNERFDSIFYKEKFDFNDCIKISKIARVSGGKRLPKGYYYSTEKSNYRYVRVGDINWDGTLKYNNFKYISSELFNILKHYKIDHNEILLAIVGATIGKCSIIQAPYDDEIILTENCAKIKIISDEILPEFLLFLLQSKFVQNQIKLNYIQTTLPKLGLDRVLSLYIPTPPDIVIQKKCLELLNEAFIEKQKKENEAKELFKSIDTYLLDKLGIKLPVRDSSYSNRVFNVKWSELSGDRFDAFSFFNNSLKIEGGYFPNKKLRKLATVNKGQSITSSNVIEGEFPVIAGGKSSPYSHNEYNYEDRTITVSASGAYSGYVWYHNEKIFASDCAVIKSKDENKITMEYLYEILKLKQKEIYGLQQGAGQPHVYPSDLVKLNIPLPSLETQNLITEYIFQLREKAQKLKSEAKSVLEEAKNKIEKMILG